MSPGHLSSIILVTLVHTCAALKCFSENQHQDKIEQASTTTAAPPSSLLASLLSPSSSDSTEASLRLETCSQFPSYSDPLVCFSRTRFKAYQLLDDVNDEEGSHRQRGCTKLSSLGVPDFLDEYFNLTDQPSCVEVQPKRRSPPSSLRNPSSEDTDLEEVCVCRQDLCNYSGARRDQLFNLEDVMGTSIVPAAATTLTTILSSTLMTTTTSTTTTETTTTTTPPTTTVATAMAALGGKAAAAALPGLLLHTLSQVLVAAVATADM